MAKRIGLTKIFVTTWYRISHPCRRARTETIYTDVSGSPLERQYVHKTKHTHFSGAIIGLSEVAENAGSGTSEDDAAVALLVHVWPSGMGDVCRPVEVDVYHYVPFVQSHLLEGFVSQDAGVIYQNIDTAIRIECIFNDRFRAVAIRNRRFVGDGCSSDCLDIRDHSVSRIAAACSIHIAT